LSDTSVSIVRKIASAGELQSVVRTMKALAAASIGQYEKSVLALADYSRLVELGLGLCFREAEGPLFTYSNEGSQETTKIGAIVFGSDQGLVGQFNDIIAEFAVKTLSALPGKPEVWTVGDRVQERIVDAGLPLLGHFSVPNSVGGIASLVSQIQVESEKSREAGEYGPVYVFHNRPQNATLYEPACDRLLPLDKEWLEGLSKIPWPNHNLPQVLGSNLSTLRALVREYLFITLFRACAESLASENASRLSAMDRADRNIGELKETLQSRFHRMRQSSIDEELFDVIAGFEAMA
jgi:F-type H+-transporting ATPase subunit gamma